MLENQLLTHYFQKTQFSLSTGAGQLLLGSSPTRLSNVSELFSSKNDKHLAEPKCGTMIYWRAHSGGVMSSSLREGVALEDGFRKCREKWVPS